MRRILLCISAVLFSVILHAQDNPVIMDVNGYEVRKSEFEYFFRKNNTETSVTRKTVRQYADLYLNFKLKVQAALDEGLDKSQSFLNEYRMYRDMQAEDYLIDKDFLEEVTRNSYDQSVLEVGADGLVHLFVISSTPREETLESLGKSVELLESVYKKLEAGENS
jgi:peptidyl-prolyl cis-trans isomerase SurA